MGRKKVGLQAAIKAAYFSDLYKLRVGSALLQGSRVINLGWNTKKTHPNCNTELSQHAEFNVFNGIRHELIDGCDLYIARITRTSLVRLARPCEDCQEYLKNLPLNKIFYTNDYGKLELFRWNSIIPVLTTPP